MSFAPDYLDNGPDLGPLPFDPAPLLAWLRDREARARLEERDQPNSRAAQEWHGMRIAYEGARIVLEREIQRQAGEKVA